MGRRLRLQKGELDLETGEIVGTSIRLNPKELSLASRLADSDAALPVETLLTDVWGYRPGVRSRTVYSTVGRLRKKIEVNPKEPVHLLQSDGGYRLVEGAEILELPDDFHGRVDAVATLRSWVAEGGVLGIHGSGGVGKTRLAEIAVTHLASRFQTHVWVALRGVRQLEDGLGAVARALGLGDASASRIRAALSARQPILLVLDDLDDLHAHAADLVEALEPSAARTVLVTARRQVPGARPLTLRGLDVWASRRMLRAGRRLDVDDEALDRLAEQLDHLPLALTMAAHWIGSLGAAALFEQGAILKGLHGTVERSWSRAPAPQRSWLCALAVVGGEAPLSLALALGPDEAMVHLQELVHRSLAQVRDGRVRLLETVRSFAADRAADPLPIRAAALGWAAEELERVVRSIGGPEQGGALAQLRVDQSVLVRVLEDSPRDETWDRAVLDFAVVLCRVGLIPQIDGWLQHVSGRACVEPMRVWSLVRQSMVIERRGGDPMAPLRLCPEPRPETHHGADYQVQLGVALLHHQQLDEAAVAFRSVVVGWPQTELVVRRARLGLARVRRAQRDLDGCLDELGQLERLARIAGDGLHELVALGTRAQVARQGGEALQAEVWTRQARALALELGEAPNAAHLSKMLGTLCGLSGRVAEGRRYLREALSYYQRHALLQSEGFVWMGLACLALWEGDYDGCETDLVHADRAFASTGFEPGLNSNQALWGRARASRGELRPALAHFERAEAGLGPSPSRRARAMFRGLQAVCRLQLGETVAHLPQLLKDLPDDPTGVLIGELIELSQGSTEQQADARARLGHRALDRAGG
ncbi:MAG: winged helix-turn-helix domain-containing protein [Myxococcales bacterium]|nr:winged helix-turn-helix domain-containing protein [Myxococcales bacterium]